MAIRRPPTTFSDTISTADIADDAVTGAKIENNPTIAGNLSVGGTAAVTGTSTFTGASTFSGGIANAGTITAGTVGSSVVFPASSIVQVKHKNYTTISGYNSTSTSRVVITNFYQDITPKYSDSLILAQAHLSIGFDGTPEWSWFVDAEISSSSSSFVSTGTRTILGAAAQVGNRMQGYHGGPRDNGAANFTDEVEGYSNTVSHTPSSTNPIRYQVCFMNRWSNNYYYYINRSHLDGNSGYTTRGTSTLTLYEVKQ